MKHTLLRLPALAAVFLVGCATVSAPVVPVEPVVPVAVETIAPAIVVQEPTAPDLVVVAAAEPEPEPEGVAVDPLRPGVRIDLNDASARADLWDRTRQGFGMPDLDNALVRKWEQYYLSRPDYMQRMFERGGRYLFHIVEELSRRNLPTELALLPFVESAFNPQAMSTAKASGMWQFVPGTGRDFALKQNIFRDDRRDVLASTRAALDYLAKLHGMFNDWHLALAAYNWGQGSVQRAIVRNQKAGAATGYDDLTMPDETRNYVPKLQAIKNLVARPDAYSLTLPELHNHPYFLAVPIERDIDIDLAARLSGLSLEEFKQLNPQMNKPVILAAGTPRVLLPYDAANTFVRAMSHHTGMLASWTAWVAPKTVRPVDAARLVGMSEERLREVNHIPPRMLVQAGSTLLVPRNGQRSQDVAEHIADTATLALAPDGPTLRRTSIKAGKRGSTVVAVARQYKISPIQVALWNGVTAQSTFKAGQAIVLMLPERRGHTAGKSVRSATRVATTHGGKRAVRPARRG